MFRFCCCILLALLAPVLASSQVVPTFRGGGASLWVGAEYSNFNSDFASAARVSGAGAYVVFNRDSHWSAEANTRFLRFVPAVAGTEDTYMLGPRYMFLRRGPLQPFVKALFGVGKINFPFAIGTGSYFIYAPGGGVEYRLARKLSLRGDYEYEFWPSAPGIPGLPDHGLTPNGFSVGLSYRLFRAGSGR